MTKLALPTVTLCAATSVNLAATLAALRTCLDQVDFAACLLFTDHIDLALPDGIRLLPIKPLRSGEDYSKFILRDLCQFIQTDHVLIVQWDGFIEDARRWRPEFLEMDYVGAPWPQFDDRADVGNGGFSLRSQRLLEVCLDPDFRFHHPEDIAVCRSNRKLLEQKYGLRFADRELAKEFSHERAARLRPAFGFHGVFNIIPAIGADRFWDVYRSLDHRDTAIRDWWTLARQLNGHPKSWSRRLQLAVDVIRARLG